MFDRLIEILKANPRKIVFTEGPDARILEAADRLKKGGSPYRQRPRRAGHRAANTGVFRRRGGQTRRTGRSGTEHRAGKALPATKNGPEQKGNQPG